MAYHGTMSLASTKRFNSATFSRSAWQIFTSQGDEVKIVVLGVLNLHVLPLPIPISIYSPTRLGGDPNIYCICVSWGTRTDYYSGKKSDTDWYENRASILASSEGLHDLFSNIRSQISFCWKWSCIIFQVIIHYILSLVSCLRVDASKDRCTSPLDQINQDPLPGGSKGIAVFRISIPVICIIPGSSSSNYSPQNLP